MALYALALFYVACKDLLQPFNPVPKFIIIKSVVFLTYWQVIFIHLSFLWSMLFSYFRLYLFAGCIVMLDEQEKCSNYISVLCHKKDHIK